MEIAQSTDFIETQSAENIVSIVSEPDSQVTMRKSTNLKVKKLKQRKHKLRKKSKMKAIEKDDDLEITESIEETNHEGDSSSTVKFLIKNVFECLTLFITAYFNLMNTIFKSPTGIIWGAFCLLAFQIAMYQATPISTNDASTQTSLTTMLNSLGPNPSFILNSVNAMEASSFIVQLDEVRQEEFYGLATSCSAIPIQHEICLAHPASYQSTQMNIDNFEKAITTLTFSILD